MSKKFDLLIAAGEKSALMRYATAFATPDDYLYFRSDEEAGMIVSPLEYGRALSEKRPDVTLYGYDDFPSAADHSLVSLALALAWSRNITEFRVPADFPLLMADRLRAAGLRVTPDSGSFFPEREFKREDEIREITQALRLAEDAVRAACRVIAESTVAADRTLCYEGETLTSEKLRGIIDLVLVAGGAQPTGTIAAGGLQSAEPHNPGSGPLYAGTPIVMDVFPRLASSGYWGDLTRTVFKTPPPDRVLAAYRAVREARERCKAMLRPGVIPARVHEEAVRILTEAGFHTGREGDRDFGFFHGLGHGVGLEIHEAPRLAPRATSPLQGGEVVTVEPGLYYPEWGGIRLEDLVVIRPDGAECLTSLEDIAVID